jgi:hypothetical protein
VVAQDDYKAGDCDVIPVSDPNVVTDMQRLGRAQYLLQFLGKGLNDMEINRRALEGAGIPDIEGLAPKGPPPVDPRVQLESDKLKLESQKLQLEVERLGMEADAERARIRVEEATGMAKAAKDEADAHKTMMEAAALGPDLLASIGQYVREAVQAAVSGMSQPQPLPEQMMQEAPPMAPEGMSDDGSVQPGAVRGVEEQPVDQGVPPVPEGPAGDLGPAMDGGGADVPGSPDVGQADGGVGEPDLR